MYVSLKVEMSAVKLIKGATGNSSSSLKLFSKWVQIAEDMSVPNVEDGSGEEGCE